MDTSLIAQFIINGLMLGMMYALVAVGFTLFFGVLNVIVFSHGDTVMLGAFTGLATYAYLSATYPTMSAALALAIVLAVAIGAMALFGVILGRTLIMRLRRAPALNTLLATMMLGTVMRESIRLFYPNGSNPQPFHHLLPDTSLALGALSLRLDNVILFLAGAAAIIIVHLVISRTRIGMAIRAVSQDEEAAQLMGVNLTLVLVTAFALGNGVGALAGVMNGIYYSEINFGVGLMLGAIGFSAAVIGGLGNIYGAIIGGFLFAFLQTIGAVALPFGSAYKDVFAFGVVIALIAWKPTGLLAEKVSRRV